MSINERYTVGITTNCAKEMRNHNRFAYHSFELGTLVTILLLPGIGYFMYKKMKEEVKGLSDSIAYIFIIFSTGCSLIYLFMFYSLFENVKTLTGLWK